MAQYKTPGVYLVEKDAFPNSVAQVATGIPLFVGYTEKAKDATGASLFGVPTRVETLLDYTALFGGAPETIVDIDEDGNFVVKSGNYFLYRAMQLFYANGGGVAWIYATSAYDEKDPELTLASAFVEGGPTEKQTEPDLVVVPDAMTLERSEASSLYQAALARSEALADSRIVIMDIPHGAAPPPLSEESIESFRDSLGNIGLNNAALYYPWLRTNLFDQSYLQFCTENVVAKLKQAIENELDNGPAKTLVDMIEKALEAYKDTSDESEDDTDEEKELRARTKHAGLVRANEAAIAQSERYKSVMSKVLETINLQPASGAIAGVYARTDTTRGVFKAPANQSLQRVVAPSALISNEQQGRLQWPINGKAINPIRSFVGRGVLIWGARTLDGNSNDWRYINVRRTLIMLESSIRVACQAYVFEPNTIQTWNTLRVMIENFLTNQWKEGALTGATPSEAFNVSLGLGETMTSEDVLNGLMKVEVHVAVVRPSEFIALKFQQQMQPS